VLLRGPRRRAREHGQAAQPRPGRGGAGEATPSGEVTVSGRGRPRARGGRPWAPARPSTSLCSLPLSLLLPRSARSLGGPHARVADVRESAGNSGRPARPRA
jgi:hypothetical protein